MDLRRLQDDLHGFFKGEAFFDDVTRRLYSTDASIFQVKPAGVVLPRDEEDVAHLVKYAQDQGIALIARGAGTGLAGESLGSGLVVDLSKHFRQIVEVAADSVRVQPGVTHAAVNARLAEVGRRFAPDPSNGAVCTIGGMLANNASGSRALKYGYTSDHVHSLRAVLDSGDAVTIVKEQLPHRAGETTTHLDDVITALTVLLEENRELIATCKPRTPFNRLGYHLDNVLRDDQLDLPRLLVGSEGTLAFFTEATLNTIPLPGGRCILLASVASVERAIQAVQRILASGPSACELIDRRLLSLARGGDGGAVGNLISPSAEAVLIIEYETDTSEEARTIAQEISVRLEEDSAIIQIVAELDPERQETIWQIREIALPSLYGMRSGAQPIPYIEDVGVPVERLHEYMRRVQDILQEHDTTASFLVHAGAGQVHTRPFLDLQKADDVSRLWSIAEKVHALALELGGTVSTQHAAGLARTPWIARQYGPLYPVFRQVKAIFDPKNIFNPGKIVDPDPDQATRPLRVLATTAPAPVTLNWRADAMLAEANHCNGCGHCRTELPGQRMCPIFRATHDEAASPRAKANLLRDLLQQSADGMLVSSEEVRAVADLCVHCKMCAAECPAHINIPKMMLEAKAANVAEHGMDGTDWFFARLEPILRWGSAVSFLANLAIRSRTSRWFFDKVFGVSAQRRLPRFASRSFMSQAKRRGWTRKPSGARPVVLYFVDLYANYVEPQIAEATVAVLQHNGFDVFVPPEQRGSGLDALVHGDVETAREVAQKNLRVLVEAARAGWPIVCSEPSGALMLSQDYLDLQTDDEAHAVAERTVELTAFLWRLHEQGKLRTDFAPLDVSVGHHVPCHVKAINGPIAGPELLRLIPQLRLNKIDVGCSGMAGSFGMKSANYDTSRLAGAAMLTELRRPRHLFGSTECSSCRLQMEDGAEKRTLHPIQYLALAYGLLPEVADRLREPMRELILR